MHYGKRFPFVDLLIVTMITYGRLSLSGVVGDHPGETTIRKGRSMNIQLMNVAVDIIEQRLAPLASALQAIDAGSDAGRLRRVQAALLLVLAAPEFIVQK